MKGYSNHKNFIESELLDNSQCLFCINDFSAGLFLAAIDNIYDSVIIVDNNGIIRFMTKNYEDRFGIEREKAIGEHITKMVPNAGLLRVLETGRPEIDFAAEIKGKARIISRIPLKKGTKIIGALGKVMFWKKEKLDEFYNFMIASRSGGERDKKYDYCPCDDEFSEIIGNSKEIQYAKYISYHAARTNSSVLIRGDSGTGKELFAKAIHQISSRRKNAFICVNCTSIPRELFESELFGYKPGAFTGASRTGKIGKFELAHKGTIFLDEIGDMDLNVQAKLLRALQEKEIEKIGSQHPIKVDFRVICATNQNIQQKVKTGSFRLDLYHRINEFEIELPPLCDIKEDIPLFVDYFMYNLKEKGGRYKKGVMSVSQDVLKLLENNRWNGNIRELKNVVQRAFVFCMGSQIEVRDLPPNFLKAVSETNMEKYSPKRPILSLKSVTEHAEKQAILETLKLTENNKVRAAKLLNIHRTSLYQKLKKHGLT